MSSRSQITSIWCDDKLFLTIECPSAASCRVSGDSRLCIEILACWLLWAVAAAAAAAACWLACLLAKILCVGIVRFCLGALFLIWRSVEQAKRSFLFLYIINLNTEC